MIRSLWTGAAGMKAQQTSLDSVSNNLANVNTTGYKAQTVEFKSLLYQNLQTATTTSDGNPKPTSAQVGLGTRVASTNSNWKVGQQLASDNPTSLFINGTGFFTIRVADGNTYYTRNGDFTFSPGNDGNLVLTDSEGNEVLDTNGNPIELPNGVASESVSFAQDGTIGYQQADGTNVTTGQAVQITQFPNPQGLEKTSGNLLVATNASGAPINESNTNLNITRSVIRQGYVEGSNVNVADEMVKMIVTQRAYEMNSKSIQTSDTMMEEANNLRR